MNNMKNVWGKNYRLKNKLQILKIASDILNSQIDLLSGCRKIVFVYNLLPTEEQEKFENLFLGLMGIASQIDHLPLGDEQRNWDSDVLKEKIEEINAVTEFYKKNIISDCQLIVKEFSIYPQ